MNLGNNVIINIYSIILLAIIYFHSLNNDDREALQQKLFLMIVKITILLLVIDIFSRFDGNPDTIYPIINRFGNFMIFLLNPILPSLWLMYVHIQVFKDEERNRRLIYPVIAIIAINSVVSILTQFNGWYYYIDSNNIYHRGPLYWLAALITVAIILVTLVLTIANRKKIEKKYYFALVFFIVPPVVCIISQIAFYGISLVLNGVVLSLLIVFLNIQNHSMNTDYLTGVNNRKKLELHLKEKISTCTEEKIFSAILIDLDNFKAINDTFGHDMGDNALRISAKLISNCLGPKDYIFRFGGDEFYIVLDTSDSTELTKIVSEIKSSIINYNKSNSLPFILGFSMGYAVYDYRSNMNVEQFQKQIDILMYKNKRASKKHD